MVKTHVKLYVLHLFKQSITFSLIDKGIFYRATFSFKIIIVNVYKNLFGKCNSFFALLQKILEFFVVF